MENDESSDSRWLTREIFGLSAYSPSTIHLRDRDVKVYPSAVRHIQHEIQRAISRGTITPADAELCFVAWSAAGLDGSVNAGRRDVNVKTVRAAYERLRKKECPSDEKPCLSLCDPHDPPGCLRRTIVERRYELAARDDLIGVAVRQLGIDISERDDSWAG